MRVCLLWLISLLWLPQAMGLAERAPCRAPLQVGQASWYGRDFHGRPTASGEIYNMFQLTAAHRELPLGATLRVTHLGSGRSVVVRINDRGPFAGGRILDLSFAAALMVETFSGGAILDAAVPILYTGVMSVGVAYTLQVMAQRRAHPSHAAIILSLEAVFAALGGWIVLNESLSLRALCGCCLMLGGMIVSQLRWSPKQP